MLHEEEDDARREQEEHVFRERIGGGGIPRGIHHRGHDQQHERGSDRVPAVQARPHRVDHIPDEEDRENLGVRNGHRAPTVSGARV